MTTQSRDATTFSQTRITESLHRHEDRDVLPPRNSYKGSFRGKRHWRNRKPDDKKFVKEPPVYHKRDYYELSATVPGKSATKENKGKHDSISMDVRLPAVNNDGEPPSARPRATYPPPLRPLRSFSRVNTCLNHESDVEGVTAASSPPRFDDAYTNHDGSGPHVNSAEHEHEPESPMSYHGSQASYNDHYHSPGPSLYTPLPAHHGPVDNTYTQWSYSPLYANYLLSYQYYYWSIYYYHLARTGAQPQYSSAAPYPSSYGYGSN